MLAQNSEKDRSMARSVKGVAPREGDAGGPYAVCGLSVRGIPERRFDG